MGSSLEFLCVERHSGDDEEDADDDRGALTITDTLLLTTGLPCHGSVFSEDTSTAEVELFVVAEGTSGEMLLLDLQSN